MASRAPKAFMQAVNTHRLRLEKVVKAHGAAKMKRVYEEAQGAVLARIRKQVGAGRKDSFTAHQAKVILAQLRQGQGVVAKRMSGDLRPLSKGAQELAIKGLVEDVARLSKHFTGAEVSLPVEEAASLAGVVKSRDASLMRMHQSSMNRMGASVVQKVEKKLAVSLLSGDSLSDAYDDVAETVDGEWWQGERIVRTELSYAFNQSARDAVQESSAEIPELMQRWEENCDDSGEPLDDRVAADSISMHGQVAAPGQEFTMPSGPAPFPDADGNTKVSEALIGLAWDFPPNRPNDRAVLSPWMADWGVPGWRYQAGRRVWLVR